MTSYKFHVGEVLEFRGAWRSVAGRLECKVLRLLPVGETGQLQYRVKCTTETFDRVAKESDLSRRE